MARMDGPSPRTRTRLGVHEIALVLGRSNQMVLHLIKSGELHAERDSRYGPWSIERAAFMAYAQNPKYQKSSETIASYEVTLERLCTYDLDGMRESADQEEAC